MTAIALVFVLLAAPEPKELFAAISKGDTAAAKALIAAGVDLKVTSPPSDYSALHLTVIFPTPEIAALLLAAGADPDAIDAAGRTPLRHAAQGGQIDLVRILLEKGADTEKGNGQTPLFMAVWSNHMEVATLLAEKGATLNLYTAAALGRSEKVREFLAADSAAAKSKLPEGDTPLTYAARGGHKEACAILLGAGADPSALDREQRRPLDRAASPGVVDVLVERGADVNAQVRTRFGTWLPAPLDYAVNEGRAAVAERLVDRGAKVTWVVTFSAMDADRLELLAMLLRKGWTPTGLNGFDLVVRTLGHAAQKGRKDLYDLVLGSSGDINAARNREWTMLHYAAQWDIADAIPALVAKGAKLEAGDEYGGSPLQVAASSGAKLAMVALLDAGAKVNAQNRAGLTALHRCASRDDGLPLVALLLERGAAVSINQPTSEGDTPLHPAAMGGSMETIRLLLERGADPRIKNKRGQTPAGVANQYLRSDVAEFLKSKE